MMLGGCASQAAPYPADWPPLSSAGRDCRSVAGAYAQYGDDALPAIDMAGHW
jgi:hypothetical protein